ncbi:hypothetical protein W03_14430 [Nitrosomonas sp. PY1]|uniref:hypothetical protein n=1 Tax=Nitrosomonas sp. PY1 TaxID=1803906 RepID=UPI001FC7E105|nr:hypothetical protein [Nitrosomonas sp. PY1]GKS69439.1 hypothetical protein W03_14430 [Nitrosomonas sp. PY1]
MKIKNYFWLLILHITAGATFAQPTLNLKPISDTHSIIASRPVSCPDSALIADVVAIDHPMIFNRLGAQNVDWMMYALRHDVIDLKSRKTLDYDKEELFEQVKKRNESRDIALRPDLRPRPLVLRVAAGGFLKVNFTNLLHKKLKHLPFSQPNFANPFDYPDPLKEIDHPLEHAPINKHIDPDTSYPLGISDLHKIYTSDDQVASRNAGFHPQGLELVTSIDDDSSYVGKNKNSLASPAPGETRTYCFRAENEGAYLVSSDGAVFGGEGTSGNSGVGLFGAVTVQPSSKESSQKTRFYRAQVTEEELRLATSGTTSDGHPIVNYEATYPDDCAINGVWCQEGKAGKPILNMVREKDNRIIHGDINAMIIGPNADGSFPNDTYPLEKIGERNPTLPNRLEPFREFVSIFHDENAATQAFPYFFEHPELGHTLHGVRDAFMINYGSGGIGAEIIANRLKAGPMHDCLDCAYEEFFLSSFAVGDPAMLVDKPANLVISQCQPEYIRMVKNPDDPEGNKIPDPHYEAERRKFCEQPADQFATKAYYPHDPANVHHSYIGDFVKFRNLHSGKEQHIFHLHNHQWLFNPNDDNSNYIDAQGIGPGSGYTYEIAFGGSGNRNKTVGDAIFHCHFYPHFAQGMWYLWRNHDVFEAGTKLAVSEDSAELDLTKHYHKKPFELMSGEPAKTARALPDGEIVAGVPIPAIVPLPGKGMAPMPLDVSVKPRIGRLDGMEHGSVAVVDIPPDENAENIPQNDEDDKQTEKKKTAGIKLPNPGYPFWMAGVATYTEDGKEVDKNQFVSVGSRPTTPPLDMCNEKKCPEFIGKTLGLEGGDGGLPRHALAGYSANGLSYSEFDRFSALKLIKEAMPIYYPEQGTKLERMAMAYHAEREHATHKIVVSKKEGSEEKESKAIPSVFVTNGAEPIPGAPFNEPCMDDHGKRLEKGKDGRFFGGTYVGNNQYINVKSSLSGGIEFGADSPRIYKGANIQLDVVFNKLGYHYPQQRILALWEDVEPLLNIMLPESELKGKRPKAPEPLVLRMNTFDCAMYAHTNLIPAIFNADDYQITTPTDVIGQHIHLPKWDLTSADGSANGWNYEDGTFSPDTVRERIDAINKWNEFNKNNKVIPPSDYGANGELISPEFLEPKIHVYFNGEKISSHQRNNCLTLWRDTLDKATRKAETLCKEKSENDQKFNECMRKEDKGLLEFQVKYGIPGACDWLGARTTLQRWFSDPIVNRQGIHRGLGTTFTHDHLGPSTHQQLGLYATMLTEPPGSEWRHNETGEKLYTRTDGGPTSWQAAIIDKNGKCIDIDKDGDCSLKGDDSHREFFLQFGDFQHAYLKGAYYGVNKKGVGWLFDPKEEAKPTPDSFRFAINPSVRKPAQPVFPDILAFEPICPGGKGSEVLPGAIYNVDTNFNDLSLYNSKEQPLRPCPEAISADDVGMMVVNYRNEPIGARVYDPNKLGPDGKKGMQADGKQGDLAFAMQTRDDRAIAALNTELGNTPYEPLTSGGYPGDPFTPLIRAYSGDQIKIKIQGGSHEHEHNASINGLSWLQGGSGYGQSPHSGRRNAQNAGLSEQFNFQAGIIDYESPVGINDRMYTVDASQDGFWSGVWGAIRTYNVTPPKKQLLHALPVNDVPTILAVGVFNKDNPHERLDNVCPSDAPIRSYQISAVLANKVLNNDLKVKIPEQKSDSYPFSSNLDIKGGSLVYNPRATEISIEIVDEFGRVVETKKYGAGPLHDPTAIMFVRDEDLKNGYLKPDAPLEPLILRAAAGDCIQVTLTNRLPKNPNDMPDLDGYTSVSGIIPRNCPDLGKESLTHRKEKENCDQKEYIDNSLTSFNNNLIRPSNHIGLHPQMVSYDVQESDGNNIGFNTESTVAPDNIKRYTWYAGKIEVPQNACVVDSDIENLSSFTYPYISSLSSGSLNFDDYGQFIENILTQMDDRIAGNFAASFFQKNIETEYTKDSIWRLYKLWRQAGTDEYNRVHDLTGGIRDQWDLFRNWILAKFMRSILFAKYELGLGEVKKDCVGNVLKELQLEKLKDKDLILFDRVKILHAMNSLAECRGRPTTIVKFQQKNSNEDGRNDRNVRLIHIAKNGIPVPKDCKPEQMAHFVPIEYGGVNLTPPDRIKQGQKGAIGALVIEPEGATWAEKTDQVFDRQQHLDVGRVNLRYTRTMADVAYRTATEKEKRKFRDLVMVHQKGLNLRYKDGSAIANLAAEKEKAGENPAQTAPEDAHDSGHMAINYGAEPLWFRFGLPPDAPFGKAGFGGADSAWQAFSNTCCSNGEKVVTAHIAEDGVFRMGARIGTVISADKPVNEPYVPIMKAYAGQEMRIRALMPTGTGRGSTVELHGHSWMRDPYLAEFVHPEGYPRGGNQYGFYDGEWKFHPGWGTPSKCIGENALAMHLGGQESLTPMAHFDLIFPRAGGKYGVTGDYLWRDHGGFGITNGLWALIRVEDAPEKAGYGGFGPETLRTNCHVVAANTVSP